MAKTKDSPYNTLEEELNFPRVGDIIEWVNLLEVWAHDKWVDEGGPYFGISKWEKDVVKMGLVIEESIIEGIFHWSVWCWSKSETFHISSTTDQIRIISRAKANEEETVLGFYKRKK